MRRSRGLPTPPGAETAAPLSWLRPRPSALPTQRISCGQLAAELGVDLDRLRPLILHRYLRVISHHEDFAQIIVGKPEGAALDWLRTMFMPLIMRPYLPIEDVASMFETRPENIRYLCVANRIPIYSDPVFGEVLSVRGYRDLRRSLFEADMVPRFDRGVLLNLIGRLRGFEEAVKDAKPMPYLRKVEREIARISALPEDERAEAAYRFYNAWYDSRRVADALDKYFEYNRRNARGTEKVLQRRVAKLQKFMSGKRRGASSSAALPRGRQSDGMSTSNASLP